MSQAGIVELNERVAMRALRLLLTIAIGLLPAAAAAQDVRLAFNEGRVTLSAQNATLRAILTEWGRQGGTRLVNVERVSGTPMTIEVANKPELEALGILLRNVGGYIIGQRSALTSPTQSVIDRILIAAATPGPPAAPVPFRATPPPVPFSPPPDPDDNPASDVPPNDDPNPDGSRSGPSQPFEPQDDTQPQPPTGAGNPFGIPTGSARPGTITPIPQQNNQPNGNRPPAPDQEP